MNTAQPLMETVADTQLTPDHYCGNGSSTHCALRWRECPQMPNQRVGLLGQFTAPDASAAGEVLEEACAHLAAQGCTLAVGPMDGSTWHPYRFIVERGTEPSFFLEPDHPDQFTVYFRQHGFRELASYSSRLQPDLNIVDARLAEIAARLSRQSITIRCIDADRLERELRLLYPLVLKAFEKNFLFRAIPEDMFVDLYRSFTALIDSRLVLIAEHHGKPVGLGMAIPDRNEMKCGISPTTLIVKTVAVWPGRIYAGLGRLLWARLCNIASQLGYQRAILAFMLDHHLSSNMTTAHSLPIRRYALFARALV